MVPDTSAGIPAPLRATSRPADGEYMKSRERFRGTIIGAGAIVATIIAAATTYDSWRLHQQLMVANQRAVGSFARTLAASTALTLQSADELLRDAASWYENGGASEDPDVVNAALALRAVDALQFSELTIVDRDGRTTHSSRGDLQHDSTIAEAIYFHRLRNEPNAGLVIGESVVYAADRSPALLVSRALRARDGSFDGAVLALLSLRRLENTYAALELADGDSVTLSFTNGQVVTRQPTAMSSAAAMSLPSASALPNEPSIVRALDPADLREKIVAVARVDDEPLRLAVARDERLALLPWYDEMASASIRVGASLILVLLVTLGVLRQLRRIEIGEQALLESEERYAMAMEAANEGHIEWNLSADTVFVSRRWCALHGLPEGIGVTHLRDVSEAVRIPGEDRATLWRALKAHLSGATPSIDIEYRIVHADGRQAWVQARGRCRRDADGRPLRVFGAAHDITDRKLAEQERLALESRVQQARRMEALGTFAGGIAHDFNNLLGVILGYGDRARQRLDSRSAASKDIDRVLQAGTRAKRLVERILQFSRPEAAHATPVNVHRIVEEAAAIQSPVLTGAISVEMRLEAPDARVYCEPTQLYQIVSNLCTNAFHAVGEAGRVEVRVRRLTIESAPATLHGRLTAGDYVLLDVEDDGVGMPAELVNRIFEPFFSTRTGGEGTGLGLSVVHRIVMELEGAIDVRSSPGCGTLVSIWLPATEETPAATSQAPPRGRGEVIMVVDDEPLLLELTADELRSLGYLPIPCHSASEALEALQRGQPKIDCLITDETMPGGTGCELLEAIAARHLELPAIVMSANVSAATERRARAAGARFVLRKPVDEDLLARAIAQCLHARG